MRTALPSRLVALALALLGASAPAGAQTAPGRDRAFGGLGTNKEPINIDADRLDVFDKESRAVFAGNVVAVQGDTTMKCTTLTVFYEQNRQGGGPTARPAASTQAAGDNAIKKIDCKGPVTIVSKTQVATGDNATFDRVANRVFLLGNVALTDGPNVTRGERIVYDLNSGVANVETAPGGRVKALFVPGSGSEAAGGAADGGKTKPQRPATN
jgi:lipopolysaccharide export system protein LptA